MPVFGETPPTAARVAAGPGVMLLQAREALGMSREELARRTRLELKLIDALESEAWERLAGPAFIKGYIRSIAREIGVDPAVPLAEYNAQFHTGEPALSDFESRAPVELTTANRWIKAVSFGLVGIVLVLVAVWWQHNYLQQAAPPEPGSSLGETLPKPEPATPLPYSWTVVEHSSLPLQTPESWRRQTDGSTPPPLSPPVVEAEDAGSTTNAEAMSPGVPGTGNLTPPGKPGDLSVPVTPPAQRLAPAPAPPPLVETPPAPASPPPPAKPEPPLGTLVVMASLDSWVKVSDAKGREIWSGVVKAGRSISVSGRPPLRIYASKAGNVSVSFEGKGQAFPNTPGDAPATLTVGVER